MKKNYHWVIMISCCLMIAGSMGICGNTAGIFYTPVTRSLGIGVGAFALHTTLSGLTGGFFAPFVVKLYKKYNAKLLVLTGVLVTALSTALMSRATGVYTFYVLGIVRGFSAALFSMVPVNIIINNWFEKRHGFVTGIVFSFSGLSGVLFNSLFGWFIENHGWQATYLFVAAAILVISLPAGLLICYSPSAMDLLPYGRNEYNADRIIPVASGGKSKTGSLGMAAFISLCTFVLFTSIVTGMSQFFPGYASDLGASLSFGARMLSFAMIGNILFKFVIGVLCDKTGPVFGASTIITITLSGLVILIFAGPGDGQNHLLLASLLFGSSYSIVSVGTPLITKHLYGSEDYGRVYGYVSMTASIGGAACLTLIGLSYDIFETYKVAIGVCIALVLINLALLQIIRLKRKRQTEGSVAN